MKKKSAVLAAVVMTTALLVAGCHRDNGVETGDDTFLIIRKANATLMGVRDAQTAQAAKATLQQLTEDLRKAAANSKKAGKSGPPANEDDRTTAAAQELSGNALRARSDPAINGVLGADLDAFMKVLTGAG